MSLTTREEWKLRVSRATFRLRYVVWIMQRLLWHGETITIRVLMAAASILLAAIFLLDETTFERATFLAMATVFTQFEWGAAIGPGPCWALLFLAHGIGVFWRILETKARIAWAVAINWLGVVLWSAEVFLTNLSLGRYLTAGNALELLAVTALFVALVRTGLNDEKLTP